MIRSASDRATAPARAFFEEVGDMLILTGKTLVSAVRPPFPYGGEFVIQFRSMTYNGRIVGRQVSGTWTLRLSLFGGPPTIYTGGFTGSKVK